MYIKTYSYRFADEILSASGYCDIKQEILDICCDCPIPVYPGKSKRQANKDVVQQIMNTYFRLQFVSHGWEAEPLATPNDHEDALRADFRKTFAFKDKASLTAQIEVEFGNVASSYRNYFKFQLSFSCGAADICILIVPSYNLAGRIDSGVANFEKAVREIPQAKLSITVPIYVIGLFDVDEDGNIMDPWNVRDITDDLNVIQNKSKTAHCQHERLVRAYIDKLGRR